MPSPYNPTSLALEASDGSPIENERDPDPSANMIALAMQTNRAALLGAVRVAEATGRCNCFGLVFASRRTNIRTGIDDILNRDGFCRQETPAVGDVAVYRGSKLEIDHVGFVVEVNHVGNTPVVKVWSAWGGLGEFVHRALQSPYEDCSIEYWRLRT